MSISPLISTVKSFFQKSDALRVCRKNPALLPFYLLTSQTKDAELIATLDKVDCNYVEPTRRLTLLAVATILGRHEVVDYLLNKKNINPMARDNAGLTAFHYAYALKDEQSLKLLFHTQKVSETARDFFELFPEWNPVLNATFPKEKELVFTFKNSAGELTSGTTEKFLEMTNAQFYDGVTVDEHALSAHWAEQLQKASQLPEKSLPKILNDYLCENFASLKRDPTLFYVAKQEAAGNGVFTSQKLTAGKPYAFYGGEQTISESSNSHYIFENIDGLKIRNLCPLINDGCPNCIFLHVQLPDGRVYEVLVPLRDIEAGEALYINYCFEHPVKFNPRKELNLEEWIRFFTNHKMGDLVEEITSQFKEVSRLLDSEPKKALRTFISIAHKQNYLGYLFHTPNVLISAFFRDLIKLEDINDLEKNEPLRALLDIEIYVNFFDHIKVISEHLKVIHNSYLQRENTKDFKDFFINLCDTYSYWTINGVMQYLQNQSSPIPWNDREKITKFATVLEKIHEIVIWDYTKTKEDLTIALEAVKKLPQEDQKLILHIFRNETEKHLNIQQRLQSLRS